MLRQTQHLKSNNSKKINLNSCKNSSNLILLPGDVKSFHFPSKLNEKILQIRTVKTKKMVNNYFGNISKRSFKTKNSKISYHDNKKNNRDNFDDTSDDESGEGKAVSMFNANICFV